MDDESTHLIPQGFSEGSGQWQAAPAVVKTSVRRLVVASFNVWFSDYHFAERCNAVLDILGALDADIVGLQEIRQESLDRILREPWVRRHYCLSDVSGVTVKPYGVLLLSRLPIAALRVQRLPTFMHRSLLLADFDLNGQSLRVGVVHLESQEQNTLLREMQLKAMFPMLADADHAILMGDFNFGVSWQEDQSIDPDYRDMWHVLRPGEPGFTEDSYNNPMLHEKKRKHKTVRFDRIITRSSRPGLTPVSIELLGTSPALPELDHVFPSDHFGLVGCFQLAGTQEP